MANLYCKVYNMKKLITVFLLLLIVSFPAKAQSNVSIKLKNGVNIRGVLVNMDPTKEVVVQVGGKNLVISMEQIQSVENGNGVKNTELTDTLREGSKLVYGKYFITDKANYPDSISIKVCGLPMTFYLIRGGKFNMGYDGRHSWALKTEPIHEVTLSSFYISKRSLPARVVNQFVLKKQKKENGPYIFTSGDDAYDVVAKISKSSGLPLRLPTEAEWEYTSLMPLAPKIFGSDGVKQMWEYCSDYFAEYDEAPQTNPTGPAKKTKYGHVVRSYFMGHNKWQRNYVKGLNVVGFYSGTSITPSARLVISAEKYK